MQCYPTSSAQAKESSDQAEVTTKKTQSAKNTLHSKAPVVPFDMDLYHWDTPTHKLQPLTKAPYVSTGYCRVEGGLVFISGRCV